MRNWKIYASVLTTSSIQRKSSAILLDLESLRFNLYNQCQNSDTPIVVACTLLLMREPQVPNEGWDSSVLVFCSQKLNYSSKIFICPSTITEECVVCPWSINHISLCCCDMFRWLWFHWYFFLFTSSFKQSMTFWFSVR